MNDKQIVTNIATVKANETGKSQQELSKLDTDEGKLISSFGLN